MLATTFLSAIALLASHVNAIPPITREACRTFYGTSNGPVATTTSTRTVTFRPSVVVTSTPSVVLTGPVTTTIRTSTIITTTSRSLVTDTYTTRVVSTVTASAIVPFTTRVTTTTTSTSTVGDGTSTVAIPSNFIYPTATPGGLKARAPEPVARRGGAVVPRAFNPNTPHARGGARRYPSQVVCNVRVQTIIPTTSTVVASNTRTVTVRGPTRTATILRTSTSTKMFPDASTTVTVNAITTTTTTFTSTETDLFTTTATATYTLPATSTYYPVCATAANELTQGPSGFDLIYLGVTTGAPQDFNTPDSYSCCAACFNTPGCLGSSWAAEWEDASCELLVNADATCPANQGGAAGLGAAGIFIEYDLAVFGATFSNGPCGTFVYSQ